MHRAPPHVPANRGHGCRKVVDFASRNSSVCLDNHTKPHVDHRAIRADYLAGPGCDLGRTILEQRTNTSIAPMSAKTWQPWSRFAQPAQWILSAPSALLDDPEWLLWEAFIWIADILETRLGQEGQRKAVRSQGDSRGWEIVS